MRNLNANFKWFVIETFEHYFEFSGLESLGLEVIRANSRSNAKAHWERWNDEHCIEGSLRNKERFAEICGEFATKKNAEEFLEKYCVSTKEEQRAMSNENFKTLHPELYEEEMRVRTHRARTI